MFIILTRTTILYLLIIFAMRLMGKRQIGELQPYEFVITMLIADLAALPMQDVRLPLLLGIVPILTLLFLKVTISYIQLKCQTSRRILEGEPCILISRGEINFKALKKQQINLDELMEELRLAGYFDLAEIEYAILENNGQMSFLTTSNAYSLSNNQQKQQQKKQKQQDNLLIEKKSTLSTEEIIKEELKQIKQQIQQLSSSSNSSNNSAVPLLPKIFVVDGKVNKNALTTFGKNKVWVENELKKHKIDSIDKVLIAMTDTSGQFVYQLYDEYKEESKK
ncbi:MAG: DUF421 domain-containing protein [Clostridium sp.]|uniref:DUF421 domain-containing protein n=1 Tax=Clostridium sp. TaxID=1506 RepID=UPI0030602434